MKKIIKNNWQALLLIFAVTTWGLLSSDVLPAQLPVHFDINGHVDRYGSKDFMLWFLPAIGIFYLFFINVLLMSSPQNFSAEQSLSAIAKLNFGIVLFFMLIHIATIKEALQPGLWMMKTMPFALGLLTIFIGNYLGKLEKNFFIGIRLPWTIASDENWRQTHRFAGKCYFVAGVVSLALALIYPSIFVSAGLLLAATLSGSVYSYMFFKKYENQQ